MGFVLTLFYLFATFITPAEIMPILLPYRIMLVLLIITLLASVFTMIGSRFSFKEPQILLVLALVADASATVLWAVRWFGGAVDAMTELLFLAGIALMVSWTIVSITRLKILAVVLSFTGMVIVVQGVISLETGYRSNEFIISEYDSDNADAKKIDRIRGLGVLNDPNDLAQFLLIDIALLGCLWRPRKTALNIATVVLPGAFLFTGVLLTRSRGALIASMVLLLILAQRKMGKFGTLIGGIAGAGGIAAMTLLTGRGLSMQESSAAGRLDAWYVGMQLFKSSPLLGVGFQRFTEYNPLTAHNSYMLCLAELGFPGLCLWLSLIVASILKVWGISSMKNAASETAEIRQAARSVLLAFIMFAVTAWFLSRTYATILFVLVGCAVAVAEMARRAGLMESARTRISWKVATACSAVAVVVAIYVILRIRGISA